MKIFKIYVCSPYSVFKDDKKKAREVAIKALAEANEYFNGDERYELFSPVLNNSAYRNLSYPEVMAICLRQLDSCGALFVPSEKNLRQRAHLRLRRHRHRDKACLYQRLSYLRSRRHS